MNLIALESLKMLKHAKNQNGRILPDIHAIPKEFGIAIA